MMDTKQPQVCIILLCSAIEGLAEKCGVDGARSIALMLLQQEKYSAADSAADSAAGRQAPALLPPGPSRKMLWADMEDGEAS
jgi:hypothetical protein